MSCDCKKRCGNNCICLITCLKCTDMCSCKVCSNTVEIESDDEYEYDSEDNEEED